MGACFSVDVSEDEQVYFKSGLANEEWRRIVWQYLAPSLSLKLIFLTILRSVRLDILNIFLSKLKLWICFKLLLKAP